MLLNETHISVSIPFVQLSLSVTSSAITMTGASRSPYSEERIQILFFVLFLYYFVTILYSSLMVEGCLQDDELSCSLDFGGDIKSSSTFFFSLSGNPCQQSASENIIPTEYLLILLLTPAYHHIALTLSQ